MSDTPTCSQCHKPMKVQYTTINPDRKSVTEQHWCPACKNVFDVTVRKPLMDYKTIPNNGGLKG